MATMEKSDWMKRLELLAFILIGFFSFCNGTPERLDPFKEAHPEISDFFSLVKMDAYLKSAISWKQGTLFVPKNEAIKEYTKQGRIITNTTLLYHFCNQAMQLSDLESEQSISTELLGNSPIWVTKSKNGIFLNDAKFVIGNFQVVIEDRTGDASLFTIVHIIDRVLEPTVPISSGSSNLHNPDAWKYLQHPAAYNVSNQLVEVYKTQVVNQGKSQLYKNSGCQTFFVPVDEAFKGLQGQRVQMDKLIDSRVIFGHIIRNHGIFLPTITGNEEFETYKPPHGVSFTTTVSQGGQRTTGTMETGVFSVIISFHKAMNSAGNEVWLVNSDNRQGDDRHRKGVVQAEIIKGNIPVKNGVIHLITKPLVVIDLNVFETLRWYAVKQHIRSMGKFYDLYHRLNENGYGEEIRQLLQGNNSPTTLFVPSNQAIENSSDLQRKITNFTALFEIFKTHILHEAISADDMIKHGKMKKGPFQIQTALAGRKMLFSSFSTDGNRTIHLEVGGVNATVIHADFGATNGFIHIIDHVLGIPDQTILEKLRTHPMLQSTYHMWKTAKMDQRLNQTQEPITFFAPSEKAWTNLRRISDQAVQNLFHSTSMSQLLGNILDRHLILEQSLSIEVLRDQSIRDGNISRSKGMKGNFTIMRYPIKTFGEKAYIKVNESSTFLIKKELIWTTTTVSTTSSPIPSDKQITKNKSGESHFYVYWHQMWAHVIRPNVKCTNGIIHIIDDVLMDGEEITIAAASPLQASLRILVPLLTLYVFQPF